MATPTTPTPPPPPHHTTHHLTAHPPARGWPWPQTGRRRGRWRQSAAGSRSTAPRGSCAWTRCRCRPGRCRTWPTARPRWTWIRAQRQRWSVWGGVQSPLCLGAESGSCAALSRQPGSASTQPCTFRFLQLELVRHEGRLPARITQHQPTRAEQDAHLSVPCCAGSPSPGAPPAAAAGAAGWAGASPISWSPPAPVAPPGAPAAAAPAASAQRQGRRVRPEGVKRWGQRGRCWQLLLLAHSTRPPAFTILVTSRCGCFSHAKTMSPMHAAAQDSPAPPTPAPAAAFCAAAAASCSRHSSATAACHSTWRSSSPSLRITLMSPLLTSCIRAREWRELCETPHATAIHETYYETTPPNCMRIQLGERGAVRGGAVQGGCLRVSWAGECECAGAGGAKGPSVWQCRQAIARRRGGWRHQAHPPPQAQQGPFTWLLPHKKHVPETPHPPALLSCTHILGHSRLFRVYSPPPNKKTRLHIQPRTHARFSP